MPKKIITFLFLFILILAFPGKIYADSDFDVKLKTSYDIENDGSAYVKNEIAIKNLKTERYPVQYKMLLGNIDVENIKVVEDGEILEPKISKNEKNTELTINFKNKSLGLGSVKGFQVYYKVSGIAIRTGEVWEVSIPKMGEEAMFSKESVDISIPDEFGELAYISPTTDKIKVGNEKKTYSFNFDSTSISGIVAAFGKFQVYSFNLTYHLENTESSSRKIEIAIPPDTAYQRVYYENISPSPQNTVVDEDGNWLSSYLLKPKERFDVKVEGSIQLFASPRMFLRPEPVNLLNNIRPEKYWEADDENIKAISKNLKTPEAIYKYVSGLLKYNRTKFKDNPERLGARNILNQVDNANCLEYTDLFIALSRASGIPAREVDGYAYSENPEIQPLSLVNDVLHAWPEYWNDQMKAWVPVDPTWESTSGIDYFNKFDLRHITLVIHGKDPDEPKAPGFYKVGDNLQKDVFINYGQLPEKQNIDVDIRTNTDKTFPVTRGVTTEISNTGYEAMYQVRMKIYYDDNLIKDDFIKIIPPFSKLDFSTNIPFSVFASNTPKQITAFANERSRHISDIYLKDLLGQISAVFILIMGILVIVFFKIKKRKNKT